MANTGTRYTQKEKEQAVKLAAEIGAVPAAEQLGISRSSIWLWQKKIPFTSEEPKKTASEPMKASPPKETPQPTKTQQFNPQRGQIYYITEGPVVGHEQRSGRPAVIVSNNQLNKNLKTVEIVYLTTKLQHSGPEYTILKSSGCSSRALCSHITTVDQSRLGSYINECTPAEMAAIEKCMLAALGIEQSYSDIDDQISSRLYGIKAERDAYKDIYERLFERFTQEIKKLPGK